MWYATRRALNLVNAMHITAGVFINDESGLHDDYEVWLEELAPHVPIDQAGPRTGCITGRERMPVLQGQGRGRAPEAQRNHQLRVMGCEVVVTTSGKLDFGPWGQIFYGEFDGRPWRKVSVKIIGE